MLFFIICGEPNYGGKKGAPLWEEGRGIQVYVITKFLLLISRRNDEK